jgi:streptomycin 6-kinase
MARYDDGSVRLTDRHEAIITLDHDGLEWLCEQLDRTAKNDEYTGLLFRKLYQLKKQMIEAGV